MKESSRDAKYAYGDTELEYFKIKGIIDGTSAPESMFFGRCSR
jgi:hypothetical protein